MKIRTSNWLKRKHEDKYIAELNNPKNKQVSTIPHPLFTEKYISLQTPLLSYFPLAPVQTAQLRRTFKILGSREWPNKQEKCMKQTITSIACVLEPYHGINFKTYSCSQMPIQNPFNIRGKGTGGIRGRSQVHVLVEWGKNVHLILKLCFSIK